ncbi:MAG: arginase family protein [Bacillota bacterium]|jgi:arginase
MQISIVALPYNTQGKGQGGASGPAALVAAGLVEQLQAQGHTVTGVRTVQMSREEEQEYGGWHRVGLAGGYLADLVHEARQSGDFVLGLLADCNGVLGMLGGLQQGPKPTWPMRVGLVWIDAHGDYNTPETSPSGMLGGMPVAVAAGKALQRLRLSNKLLVPLQSPDIVMVGMRDLDDLERQALDDDGLELLREHDLIHRSPALREAMERLSAREDIVYVHVDLDILDPAVAPAAGLPSPGGLTGKQLGEALGELLSYPKVGALALVSYRADADPTGQTKREVLDAILGATAGLLSR